MEKKSQPLIFVGYCEDMKAYGLFDPSSKDVLFRRDVIFDEDFTLVSSHYPSSTCNVDYVTDHVDSFVDWEDDEHHVTEYANQPKENIPAKPKQPNQGQHDQEQPLRKSHCKMKRPDSNGYEPTDFIYFSSNYFPSQSQTTGISLLNYSSLDDPQQFYDVVRILEWDVAMIKEYSCLMKKIVHCKWVYTTKYALNGFIDKHKAQLVAKVFS